ncbi:MAG TPA: tRNA (uridine(34)/cytosine(34)/5-carboxymethylaminomethyluridine(34)-2'-O)-methyltransferase TrmL [Syntrophomonas sp.]|jgi:tRNA (cytidine/uridine-2'-O-)-methyltransferase|nr:tRNA (uridine(34)/cytosine(34)/5-carboxymethylaminomethyluridine(34)-2'-O)-methyltransferase TrmL [Syntrophomonas sp.]HRW12441.1 tRNA (uridine(34)/cytosine(34)/5-carboxymethylaminomethyluridine(34)-2'-O)-methyltransferase TrmL [Syntrophomonas sp.]
MEIVLVSPEIPQNTGNIARTCALTGTRLHLVKPLGFSLADRYMKRAGLDYWEHVKLQVWNDFEEFAQTYAQRKLYLASTKADFSYDQIRYHSEDVFVFGCETRGLSPAILERYPQQLIRIPMIDLGRSLNLSNAVAVILYEAMRQQGFKGLC